MKIGFVASAFDLFHAGHVAMLKEAKENCDLLVVALHVNPKAERALKNKPVQSIVERWIALYACKYIDRIIPYESEDDLLTVIKFVRPHIRFLGDDYRGKNFTGSELPVPIHYVSRDHGFSSTNLRKRIVEAWRKMHE